jgi:hypothetical protein
MPRPLPRPELAAAVTEALPHPQLSVLVLPDQVHRPRFRADGLQFPCLVPLRQATGGGGEPRATIWAEWGASSFPVTPGEGHPQSPTASALRAASDGSGVEQSSSDGQLRREEGLTFRRGYERRWLVLWPRGAIQRANVHSHARDADLTSGQA